MNKIFSQIAARINAVILIGSESEARAFALANADAVGVYKYSQSKDFYGFYFSNQRVYKEFMYELKRMAVVGVQRTFFEGAIIHVLCPVTEYNPNYYGGQDKIFFRDDELAEYDIAYVIWDYALKAPRLVPAGLVDKLAHLDQQRYRDTGYIRFWRGENGNVAAINIYDYTAKWAEANRYKLHCDTSANGGFDYSITINGSVKSGSISWSTGATLASIVSQFTGTDATYFHPETVSGEDFIRITTQGYSNSTFTITNATGATVDDLSVYCKVAGELQAESHRTWQAQDVKTLFPTSDFLTVNTVQYARNSYNLSYMCGVNLDQYKYYYGESGIGHGGSDTYVAENSVAARMTRVGFASLNGSGVAEQQALYDKYDGDWDKYIEASMFKIGDTNTNGINHQSYDNGDVQTDFLVSVETMDYDGNYIHAFPAAWEARQLADQDLGGGNMATNTEIAVYMLNIAALNAAIVSRGGVALSTSNWSVAQGGSGYAWLYDADDGGLSFGYKCSTLHGRSLAYLSKLKFLNL